MATPPNEAPPPPPHPLDQSWYVHQWGKTHGPYTGHRIKRAIEEGKIAESDLVCRAGGSAWVPANADDVIATLFNKPDLSAQRRVAALQKEHVASRELGRGQKGFLLFLAAIIIIGVAYSGSKNTDKKTNTAKNTNIDASTTAPMEVLKFTAQEIFDAYEANEVATDNRLKGHMIEISGVVQSIDKSVWDTMYVRLATTNRFMSANMQVEPQEEPKVAGLRRGQSVVFRCPKMVRWAGSPTGEKCLLISY
jgi:hypothetical protein